MSSPAASPTPRQVHLVTTTMMQILDERGEPLTALAVRPGETLTINVGNRARFVHNLYIGSFDALAADATADLPGIPAFAGGVRSFTFTVPTSVEDLWFGCTVPGHFGLMQGRLVVVADAMPDLVGLPEADAVTVLDASGLLVRERLEVEDQAAEIGTVIAQQPAAGSAVDPSTVVRYTVVRGPAAS